MTATLTGSSEASQPLRHNSPLRQEASSLSFSLFSSSTYWHSLAILMDLGLGASFVSQSIKGQVFGRKFIGKSLEIHRKWQERTRDDIRRGVFQWALNTHDHALWTMNSDLPFFGFLWEKSKRKKTKRMQFLYSKRWKTSWKCWFQSTFFIIFLMFSFFVLKIWIT